MNALEERLEALERRFAEADAERSALRAELERIRDSAGASEDAVGGERETPPQSAWTEPTGLTANPKTPPLADCEASDRMDDDNVPGAGAGGPPRSRSIERDTSGPVAGATDPASGVIGLFDMLGTTAGGILTASLTEEYEPGDTTRRINVDLDLGSRPPDSQFFLAGKYIDRVGNSTLVWFDVSGGSVSIEIPDPAYYTEILEFYHNYEQGFGSPPSGYADPILVPDPNSKNGWTWYDLGDLPYWHQGGDNTNCYGGSIGDSSKTEKIDLDNQKLLLGWEVYDGLNIATGNLSVVNDASVSGDLFVTGHGTFSDEVIANNGVVASTLNVSANWIKLNNGDVYAPETVTINGVQKTILVKQ